MVVAIAAQDTPFYSPSTALGNNTQEERKRGAAYNSAAPAGMLLQGAHFSTAFPGGTTWQPQINSPATFGESGASENSLAGWLYGTNIVASQDSL